MCGICGILRRRPVNAEDALLVEGMKYFLVHRGPDSEGLYAEDNVALGIRRLSIIDVSGGRQPLFDETKSLVLVANAEIYNYVELTEELKSRGHIFSTGSDCEVILHLYQESGAQCLKRLRGMFAFALWDKKNSSLFLARDRMGEKPLYMYQDKDLFAFASEFKALKKILPQGISLDRCAVNLFFHYQYVPEPDTIVSGVKKLPAAHYVNIKPDDLRARCEPYWNIQDAPAVEGEPVQKIRAGLEETIPFILRSDVPVGIALSGGIDSGAIASLAAKRYSDTLHAFTVGYSGNQLCDERRQARGLAERLGLHFHDIEISTDDFVNGFPGLVYSMDDPIADIAAYGYYFVTKLARSCNVPVMLNGFGGDELFWGYPWVRSAVRKSLFKSRIPLVKALSKNRMSFYDLAPDFQNARRIFTGLYTKTFSESINEDDIYKPFTSDGEWEPVDINICRLTFNTWLISNCVALGDRLSMASSVEMRLPLLDYKFIELVTGLRKNTHDWRLPPKKWLKDSLKDLLPQDVLCRPKRGFSPPYEEWLTSVLCKYADFLKDGYLTGHGILQNGKTEGFINLSMERNFNMYLAYRILVLEMWCRKHLL